MTVRQITVISSGLLLLSLAGCSGGADEPKKANTARRLPVEVTRAAVVDSYPEIRTYAGTLETRQTSQLAFQRIGRLDEVLVDEGDKVTTNQPLARLDVRELEQQKRQLASSRDQAKARLAELQAGPRQETIEATRSSLADLNARVSLAVATYKRIASLRRRGGSTDQQVDDARSAVDSAKGQRDSAQKQLDELLAGTRTEQITAQKAVVSQFDAQIKAVAVRIEDSEIRAPFDGTIAQRFVDTGSTIGLGQQVFTVIESGRLRARIGLPARVAKSLDADAAYSFIWRDCSVSGRLKARLPQVEQSTRNQVVVFEIEPSADADPVPGDVIRLQHVDNIQSRGFWLPLPALTKGTRGLWSAFVVADADGGAEVIRRATLEVIYTDGDRAFVRGTLKDGDRVVASGSHRIVPGQVVQSVEESAE